MRLLTELEDRMNGHGKRPVYNAGGIRPERAFARDVMAAHALIQAMGEVAEFPDEMPDDMWELLRNDRDALTQAFRMTVRDTRDEIKQRAAEILAGWLGEE